MNRKIKKGTNNMFKLPHIGSNARSKKGSTNKHQNGKKKRERQNNKVPPNKKSSDITDSNKIQELINLTPKGTDVW